MKDDKVKRIDPISGVYSLVGMIADQSFRSDKFREETEAYTVDTVCPPDVGEWETGIRVTGGEWIIVEQYESRKAAETGHQKWVKSMASDPEQKLTDIQVWGDLG